MQGITKFQWFLLIFNLLYVAGFAIFYTTSFNYEFIAYAFLVVVLFAVLYATLRISQFPTYIIVGLTIWGLLHMMGGSVGTSDGVLYAYRIVPIFDGGGDFYILKMDQLVHAFLYGVVALMFLHLLQSRIDMNRYAVLVSVTAIFASAGFGIVNEIIEFLASVSLPETGVGGYENTVLDLVFNLSGAAIAVIGYWILKHLKS